VVEGGFARFNRLGRRTHKPPVFAEYRFRIPLISGTRKLDFVAFRFMFSRQFDDWETVTSGAGENR
jgi:hypothetical protein